jgi:hypothetical protein
LNGQGRPNYSAQVIAGIQDFVERVNERAEGIIKAGKPREGAHHRAMQYELDRLPGVVRRGPSGNTPTIPSMLHVMDESGTLVSRALLTNPATPGRAVQCVAFARGEGPATFLANLVDWMSIVWPVKSDATTAASDPSPGMINVLVSKLQGVEPIPGAEDSDALLTAIRKSRVQFEDVEPTQAEQYNQAVAKVILDAANCPHPIYRSIERNRDTEEINRVIIIARGHEVCEQLLDASEQVGEEVPPEMRSDYYQAELEASMQAEAEIDLGSEDLTLPPETSRVQQPGEDVAQD